MSASELVSRGRYPIDAVDSPERQRLIEQCRADLDRHALCRLPDFIRPKRLPEMVQEMRALADKRLHIDQPSTVYPWMDNSGFPHAHPRSALFTRRYDYAITEYVPEKCLIRDLFMWDPLTDFVRDALGFETLYRSACPTESIQLNYMHDGDVLPWHFDTNDGVVSLLLSCADEGGHFQVAPYLRDEGNERYDLVNRAFDGDASIVSQPHMAPGTFVLFKGRRSMHQVSAVGRTVDPRMVVLYSYDSRPGMVFTQASQNRFRYPDSTPFLGALTPRDAQGFTLRDP